jgi:uncharacterized protein
VFYPAITTYPQAL